MELHRWSPWTENVDKLRKCRRWHFDTRNPVFVSVLERVCTVCGVEEVDEIKTCYPAIRSCPGNR